MLPTTETETLIQIVIEADALARQGALVAGYDHLMDGLRRTHQARAAGAAWGQELFNRYRYAVCFYLHRHGVKME